MWFLPVGSWLIPLRRLPGEAGSTPRSLTRPEQHHHITGSLNTPRSLRSTSNQSNPPSPPPAPTPRPPQNHRPLRVSV